MLPLHSLAEANLLAYGLHDFFMTRERLSYLSVAAKYENHIRRAGSHSFQLFDELVYSGAY